MLNNIIPDLSGWSDIDFSHILAQIVIVLIAGAFLWLIFKSVKIIWKLVFVTALLLALSFALPAVREWIFGLF